MNKEVLQVIFNKSQKNRLSEIFSNFGLLLIASLVFQLVTEKQKHSYYIIYQRINIKYN